MRKKKITKYCDGNNLVNQRTVADSATRKWSEKNTFVENTKTYEKGTFTCFSHGGCYPAYRHGYR